MDIYDHLRLIVAQNKPPLHVVELGACDGADTFRINEVLEAAHKPYTQLAVEPCDGNFLSLKRRTLACQNLTLLKRAVGAVDGEVTFWHSDNPEYYGSSSIRRPTGCLTAWPEMNFTEQKVQCITLNSLITSERPYIDFIWADIQGAEADLIEGGKEALTKTRYLYTEFCNGQLYEAEIGLDEITKRLGPGWRVVEIYPGDALFENKRMRV